MGREFNSEPPMTALVEYLSSGPVLGAPISHPPVKLADGTLIPQGENRRLMQKAAIEELEGELLHVPGSTACDRLKLTHHFAPGVYCREIFMPKGEFVIGAEHNEEHLNVVLCGRVSVIMDGEVHEIVGPATFISRKGVRKVLQIHEDVRWQTIHPNPTDERDIEKLEARLARMSETYSIHFDGMKRI